MPLATKGRVHPSRRISQDLIAMTNAGRSVQHWTTRIRYHARSYCDPEPHGTAEGPGSPGPGPPPPPNARPLGTLTTRVDRGEDRATQRSLPHAISNSVRAAGRIIDVSLVTAARRLHARRLRVRRDLVRAHRGA